MPFTEAGGNAQLSDARTLSAGGVIQSFVSGFTLKDPRVDDLLAYGAWAVRRHLGTDNDGCVEGQREQRFCKRLAELRLWTCTVATDTPSEAAHGLGP